jgi:hypothetical protein
VADLFTPKSPPWADGPPGGTPILANDLDRIEDGIEALDLEVDGISDRLDAVQAQLANLTLTGVPVVTTGTRGTPSKGRIVFDDDLDAYMGGTESEWIELSVGDVVPGAGHGAAAMGKTAKVQPGTSNILTWNTKTEREPA